MHEQEEAEQVHEQEEAEQESLSSFIHSVKHSYPINRSHSVKHSYPINRSYIFNESMLETN